MRFASVQADRAATYGVADGSHLCLAPASVLAIAPDLKAAIAGGRLHDIGRRIAAEGRRIPLDEAAFLPVIPNPEKIVCVGVNYVAHRSETGRSESKFPVL